MEKSRPELRVLLDANVLIAGIVWPRWPHEVLRHAIKKDFRLVLSRFVIGQARRRIANRFPNYLDQFEHFLETIEYELISDPRKEEIARNENLVRDPTDIPLALAAINARVDYLVSEDKDLTDPGETTEQLHKQLSVLISGTFLREVMGWTNEELEKVRGRTWKDMEKYGND